MTCCPKHLPKGTVEGKGVFLMEKVELSAANTEQRAQLPEKDFFLQLHPPAPPEQVSPSPLETAFHRFVPPRPEVKWEGFFHRAAATQAFGDAVPKFPPPVSGSWFPDAPEQSQ